MSRTAKPTLSQLAVCISLLTLLVFQPTSGDDHFSQGNDPRVALLKATFEGVELEFSSGNSDIRIQYGDYNQDGTLSTGGGGADIKGESPGTASVVRMVLIPPQGGVDVKVSDVVIRSVQDDRIIGSPLSIADDNLGVRYSDSIAEVGHPAIMRGYRVVPLIIHPVVRNSLSGDLEAVESANIRLDFTADASSENQVINQDHPRPSRYINRLISNLVINPPEPSRDEDYSGGSIVYVIGEWDEIEEGLDPLVEWRRRLGWKVEVLRVRSNHDRVEIYDALQEAYEEWEFPPEYIVLVGDAPGLQGNNYTLAFWNMQDGGRFPYETDHLYTMLEGNDLMPEAAIGRLVIDSEEMLEGHVNKIIQYESDPYIGVGEERGWYLRAAGAATDSRSGMSSIDLCEWFEELVMSRGFDSFDALHWSDNNPQPNPSGFIRSNINDGISFLLYRGWANMNGFDMSDVNQLRNGRMLPFVVLATCNTGDYGQVNNGHTWSYAERFSLHPDGGAIGCVGAAGATHSAYNNMLASGTLRAPFVEEINSQGWALMRGKMELYTHYADRGDINHEENDNMEAWLTEFYIYNLMGDPAVELYTEIPRELDADHPAVINAGETSLSVYVCYADEEVDAEGIQVCLYKSDQFQLVKETDNEGWVDFILDPEWIQGGEIEITASGRNLAPYLGQISIVDAEMFIGAGSWVVDDDNEGDSQGDEDGTANPSERIELLVDIVNYGEQVPEGEMNVILTSESPWVEIIEGVVNFNVAPDGGERFECEFLVDIQGGFHGGNCADFNLEAVVGEQRWNSSIAVPVEGWQLSFAGMVWRDDPLMPGDSAQTRIVLKNYGSKSSPELDASLLSYTNTVTVPVFETSFESINAGDEGVSIEFLSLIANFIHLGGSKASFALILSSEGGFRDTLHFDLIVDRARDGQPFGPDEHGYICVDNTDEDWHFRPEYNWIEIDPDRDGNGIDTRLVDTDEEEDASTVIDLPFDFVYYGERFDEVTICTNGWIALGDHHQLISARNRRIPAGEVIAAMICPFWDDLVTTQNGGIYYWFDEDNHTFIVEWSRMRKLGPEGNREPWESFEVVLFDPAFYPSMTGDGDILFQYREVTDDRSCFQAWDTPFATVGIGSPDQTCGLEYSYWGTLHDGAAELVPGRAIKFTTTAMFETGCIDGFVRDSDSGEPLPDALVTTSLGSWSITDEEGYFIITQVPADTGYTASAACNFYNDSTITRIEVMEEDTTEVCFDLLSPGISIDPNSLDVETYQDEPVEDVLTVNNPGSGTLVFESMFRFPDEEISSLKTDETDELWEPLLTWSAGHTVGDYRLHGIVFAEDKWIISGGNNGYDQNWFYRFTPDGQYMNRIAQPIQARYGIRDIEYFDDYLYCVFSESFIIKLHPESGEEVERWDLPGIIQSPRSITVDPREGTFYVSGINGGLYALTADEEDGYLEIINQWEPEDPRDGHVILPYGLAWFRDDPDNFNVYMISNYEPENDIEAPNISIYKLNIYTGETVYLTNLGFMEYGYSGRGGITITPEWDGLHWALAGIFDNPDGDIASVLSIGQNSGWIDYTPRAGTVYAGESSEIAVSIDPSSLPDGEYSILIQFNHNAFPGKTEIPVEIAVLVGTSEKVDQTPGDYYLAQNYPNPFNPSTSIEYGISAPGDVQLTIFDMAGREVSRLVTGNHNAGIYRVQFDGSSLATGVYLYRLEMSGFTSMRKMVLVK